MIDLNMIRQISFGDESIMTQLLESALNDLSESEKLIQNLNFSHNKIVFDIFHKFKTTCVMLGASSMIMQCQKALDSLGDKKELNLKSPSVSSILTGIPLLKEALLTYLNK